MNADFRIDGKVIETKRLILRSFKQTDLEDFYEYASVEGVGEMAGWKHHENIAESQSIMNSFIREDTRLSNWLSRKTPPGELFFTPPPQAYSR